MFAGAWSWKIWDTEMPGVLNRALEGLAQLRQRAVFLPPPDCERAAREFLAHANSLNAFLAACRTRVCG